MGELQGSTPNVEELDVLYHRITRSIDLAEYLLLNRIMNPRTSTNAVTVSRTREREE